MSAPIPGFPSRFPVRDDGRRSLRFRVVGAICRAVIGGLFAGHRSTDGEANIPAEGPLIVACNHVANWDPFIFGGFFPGDIYCLAKREIYRPAAVAWIIAGCNCIPIDRGAPDRRALRHCLEILRNRGRLLIFVEGTRSRTPGMRQAEHGVGFLIRKTGARVLPVAVSGTDSALRLLPWPRRKRIHVRYGRPFDVTATTDGEIADEVAAHVAALLPPRYRGVYAEAAAQYST